MFDSITDTALSTSIVAGGRFPDEIFIFHFQILGRGVFVGKYLID